MDWDFAGCEVYFQEYLRAFSVEESRTITCSPYYVWTNTLRDVKYTSSIFFWFTPFSFLFFSSPVLSLHGMTYVCHKQ